ncbi:glycosyltransferase [Citrobacter sp. Ce006]|uniref:glycosyltransferase n=1 Tax=Citrobacter sp. Ce006 TaxID=2985039 RepID=UPI0025784398|nr:glycosyltransferase [Citrobacter sp. Ce006]MDM3318227.1 glycosyltransferase [Citrobacter sp. Ce006]
MSARLKLLPGLKSTEYVYSDLHALLDSNAGSSFGPNIGSDGSNLTITCLSMSRVFLTEKLVNSIYQHIPNFKGDILIVDNGSTVEELSVLQTLSDRVPLNIRVVELGDNFGVSGGRNKTLEHIKTEWAMFLDNDIYFINNPLLRLQKDISRLGCHFINMPLLDSDGETLFANGGNIFLDIDNDSVHVGAGSACVQEKTITYDGEGFLSTFLFGGASVIKIDSLKNLGKYDENMFIGFEDIDLSLRLYQSGMKVGTCGAISLIHDHPKPSSNKDKDYEKIRFTRSILKESADYLENKWGMVFWSAPVDDWLEEKQRSFELITQNKGNRSQIDDNELSIICDLPLAKPRIALIIDTENWAFSNIANQIVNYLSDSYDFTIIPTEIVDNISQVIMMTKNYDITHFFWRESLRLIYDEYYINYNRTIGFDELSFKKQYLDGRIITSSVYDHLFLDEQAIKLRKTFYNDLITAYTVSSSKLYDIYSSIAEYPNPSVLAEDGVNLKLFYPIGLERFNNIESRTLRVGWAGNSKWAGEVEDFKGYHSLLKPAVEQLQSEGLNIELVLADRQLGFIPHDEMVNYYSQIDVYVCPSKIEGTPNPVLESMACGVPVISTDVGVVNDAFGDMQKEWILPVRNKDILIDKLRDFYNKRSTVIKCLSSENLQQIKKWDWEVKSENFRTFFDKVLESKKHSKINPKM